MAWWLLDSVIKGTLDEDYPIMSKDDDVTIVGGAATDTVEIKGAYYGDYVPFSFDSMGTADTITFTSDGIGAADTINFGGGMLGGMGEDHISFSGIAGTQWDDNKYYADGYDPYPVGGADTLNLNIDTKPEPILGFKSQKYEEDKGIKDLKDYISSTYSGHYTSEQNSTQTLDLIQSVGDAESFCRSNAIKYLARYDKKGQAKRDILKAMHYCLLLYYFSGNTNNETPTRGYETF